MSEYQRLGQNLMQGFAQSAYEPSPATVVAATIWTAVTDSSDAGHYNYKFDPTETLIHFKNGFYIAIGFPGSGLHLHVKV